MSELVEVGKVARQDIFQWKQRWSSERLSSLVNGLYWEKNDSSSIKSRKASFTLSRLKLRDGSKTPYWSDLILEKIVIFKKSRKTCLT